MEFDNVIIHYYPDAACIAKCAVNLRQGNKIVFRTALKDPNAACNWLMSRGFYKRTRTIVHWDA